MLGFCAVVDVADFDAGRDNAAAVALVAVA